MSVRSASEKAVVPLALMALLFVTGCSQPTQPDNVVTPSVVTESLSPHPDRQPTKADVDAGMACFQAPISVIVWKESDRKYVGEGIWCKYEAE